MLIKSQTITMLMSKRLINSNTFRAKIPQGTSDLNQISNESVLGMRLVDVKLNFDLFEPSMIYAARHKFRKNTLGTALV